MEVTGSGRASRQPSADDLELTTLGKIPCLVEPAWHRNLRAARARARNRLQDIAAVQLLQQHHGSSPPAMSLKSLLKNLGQLLKAQGKGGGKGGNKGGGGKGAAAGCHCCGSLLHKQKDCPKLYEFCRVCGVGCQGSDINPYPGGLFTLSALSSARPLAYSAPLLAR